MPRDLCTPSGIISLSPFLALVTDMTLRTSGLQLGTRVTATLAAAHEHELFRKSGVSSYNTTVQIQEINITEETLEHCYYVLLAMVVENGVP